MPNKVTRRPKSRASTSAPTCSGDGSDLNGTNCDQQFSSLKVNKNESVRPFWLTVVIYSLALLAGYMHWEHVSTIHENHLHFSYLSNLERELSFRTEMGFYYSYFKQIVEAPTYARGLLSIVIDNVTEFPDSINSLRRFNLYPEVVIGGVYRIFISIVDSLGLKLIDCYQTNRGEELPMVESCEGIVVPPIFYVRCVFLLSGFMMSCFFLLGCEIAGGSVWGGILAVTAFFCNHDECTRVQWTPPLRESFSYPLFVLQQLVLVRLLKSCRRSRYITRQTEEENVTLADDDPTDETPSLGQLVTFSLVTVLFMLPWQFAQFALLTQSLAVMAAYMLDHLDVRQFRLLVRAYLLALAVSFALQFGNRMLLSSAYSACLLAMLVVCAFHRTIYSSSTLRNSPIRRWLCQVCLLGGATLLIKWSLGGLLQVEDDKHIWQILRSKFTKYTNFHTRIYTCAKEFDFIDMSSIVKLYKTLLLPATIVACMVATYRIVHSLLARFNRPHTTPPPQPQQEGQESPAHVHYLGPEVPFLLLQLLAFTGIAVLIMRLKLFWTPQMCLTAALLARPYWPPISFVSYHSIQRGALLAALLAGMMLTGYSTISNERSMMGEFSNWPMEQLMNWLVETKKGSSQAAFAGPMAIMAAVRLGSGRPIVNHPHYENAGIRHRTELVYSFYSRLPVEDIWRKYRYQLKASYVIFEPPRCQAYNDESGCSTTSLYDLIDPSNKMHAPMCSVMLSKPRHSWPPYFVRVFTTKSGEIEVFRVWDGKS